MTRRILKNIFILLVIAAILVFALVKKPWENFGSQSSSIGNLPDNIDVEVIMGGLNRPTALAFTPDGRILIAEKTGRVLVIKNGELLPEPMIELTDINTYGDRGLLGMAVDPNFEENGYVYLSYTHDHSPGLYYSGEKTGRIVRVTAQGDLADESTKEVILGSINGNSTYNSCDNLGLTRDCIPSDSESHSLGDLKFGPDGMLYASLGDGATPFFADERSMRSQNKKSLSGKLVRINTDGTAASDNPFYNGNKNSNQSKVFAYGFRNAFRFNFDENGDIYIGDVGWDSFEEVNKVEPGANYGWPCYEGSNLNEAFDCANSTNQEPWLVYPHEKPEGGAVVAGVFLDESFGQYANSYLFGDYAINKFYIVPTDQSNSPTESIRDFITDADGPVYITLGPDGSVYYLAIYTGELRRMSYTTGDREPRVSISASNTTGKAPFSTELSAKESYDPEGKKLSYIWDIDGQTYTQRDIKHEFKQDGDYLVTLTVTDKADNTKTATTLVSVGKQAPLLEISSPETGSSFLPNEPISLEAWAEDLDNRARLDQDITWDIILHHNTHTHDMETLSGPAHEFVAPEHGDSNVYIQAKASVVGSSGITTSKSTNIYFDHGSLAAGNLIENPSIETPDPQAPHMPNRWIPSYWGEIQAEMTYPIPGTLGKTGIKINVTSHESGDAKWMYSPVKLTPGQKYVYSFDYKSDAPSSVIAEFENIYNQKQYASMSDNLTSDKWKRLNIVFTAPETVNVAIIVPAVHGVGELSTDNHVLQEVTKEAMLEDLEGEMSVIAPTELILSEPSK